MPASSAYRQNTSRTHSAFRLFCARALRVLVLLVEGVVQPPHQLAGLDGDFHFLLEVLAASVHQEAETVVFLFQVAELHDLRLSVGLVHVVDVEFLEVGDHDPARVHVVGQETRVAPRLLEG